MPRQRCGRLSHSRRAGRWIQLFFAFVCCASAVSAFAFACTDTAPLLLKFDLELSSFTCGVVGATPKVPARGRARPMPTPEGQPERRRVSREVEDELSDSDLVEARKAQIARLLHGALPESEPGQVLGVAARLEEAGVQFAASVLEKRSSSLADGAAVTSHEEL